MTRYTLLFLAWLALLMGGCAPAAPSSPASPVPPPTALPLEAPASGRTRVVEPSRGWPRTVQTPRGTVTIKEPPRRIHTLSLGFDEITFALVEPGRIAAVGRVTANPDWSNVADLAQQVPLKVGRDAEEVLAARPDLVVAYPLVKEDLVRALESAGVPVVMVDQYSGLDVHLRNIRLLAYLYGEEERGERLVQEASERLARVDRVVARKPPSARPRVLMLSGNTFTPGAGSNEDEIIRRAGGINLAAEAGIKGNKQLSLEAIPAMDPDLLLLVEQDSRRAELQNTVLNHPALQEVPAIKYRRYFLATHRYLTTLSHWNVNGVEELARLFYPGELR